MNTILTVETATQAKNAITDYCEQLQLASQLRLSLSAVETELAATEAFLTSLGLFGVTIAPSAPAPILAAVEPVAVDLPGATYTPETIDPVPAPKSIEPVAPSNNRLTCAGFRVPECGKALSPSNKNGLCKSCSMRRVQAGRKYPDGVLAEADAPRICAGYNKECSTVITRGSKSGLCPSCATTKVRAETKAIKAEPAPIESTPSEEPEALPVEAGPVIKVEAIEVEPSAEPSLPMPSTTVAVLLAKESTRTQLMAARAKAVQNPEVVRGGIGSLSWEWYEDKTRGAWEIVCLPWEVDVNSLGMIEVLRRDGDAFVSSATDQPVGRVQS